MEQQKQQPKRKSAPPKSGIRQKKAPRQESQVSRVNRKLRDISATKARERDSYIPLPAPFFASSPPISKKQADKTVVYSRQLQPDDIFTGSYERLNLIVPPYSPTQMYSIYESSSILSPHIDAYIQNISGFDIFFKYKGEKGKKDSDEAVADKERLISFFRKVNEKQSFKSVRKLTRLDYEVLGYSFIEITRSADGEIACIYPTQAKYIRLARLSAETEQEITVKLPRGPQGKLKSITLRKKFRRFAQIIPGATTSNIRWFKEYGDQRVMDAKTGKFEEDAPVKDTASELIHLKNGNDTYGMPRWVGNIMNVLGARSADYVNYDLFDSQGIPPLVIMVSGGILTQDSLDTIEQLLRQAKGYQNFNRLLLLEAQSEGGIDDKMVPKVEFKSLTETRADDAMFQKYITSAEEKLRMDFRLPAIYLGKCVPIDTEFLTQEGWMYFDNIKEEKIATVNNTGMLEYQSPTNRHEYEYEGELLSINNGRAIDFVGTPNHRMYIRTNGTAGWKFRNFSKLPNYHTDFLLGALDWEGKDIIEFVIPKAPKKVECNFIKSKNINKDLDRKRRDDLAYEDIRSIDIDLFLEFLGYYIAEGSLSQKGNNVSISQNSGVLAERMKFVIKQIGVSKVHKGVYRGNQEVIGFASRHLYTWLKDNCGDGCENKTFPRWILDLPKYRLKTLYDSLMDGDGSKNGREDSGAYSTVSKNLADLFQELCFKLGFRTTSTPIHNEDPNIKDIWRITVSSVPTNHVGFVYNLCDTLQYTGRVCCFTTDNGTIVTRRNGKIMVSGNSQDYTRSCYSEDTETLTDNGFKTYDAVLTTDRIATVNPETLELEFKFPNGLYVYPYSGDMIHFESRAVDVLVTPDHDMWCAPPASTESDIGTFRKEKAETIKQRWFLAAPSKYTAELDYTYITIPALKIKGGPYFGIENVQPIPAELFFEFLGYFLSEGSLAPEFNSKGEKRHQYTVSISQKVGDKALPMEDCIHGLGECGFRVIKPYLAIDDVNHYSITSKSLYFWLLENCGRGFANKHIPREFLKANNPLLKILYNAMMLGDGTVSKKPNDDNGAYYTASDQLAEDFQELCIRLGIRSKKSWGASCWRIMVCGRKHFRVSPFADNIHRVPYSGYVYCFDVPNHLFITRRNGKIGIHGNTVEISRIIAEEQIYEPERQLEDEVYNNTIMEELQSKYWDFKSGGPPLVTGEGLLKGFDSMSDAGAFTINQSLDIANRAMGLDYEEIKEEWADFPLCIVTRLLDRGFFADLQQLIDVLEGNAAAINNPTVLLEGPAANNTNTDVNQGSGPDIVDAEVDKSVSQLLNSVLNKAKSQLLSDQIGALKTEKGTRVQPEQ